MCRAQLSVGSKRKKLIIRIKFLYKRMYLPAVVNNTGKRKNSKREKHWPDFFYMIHIVIRLFGLLYSGFFNIVYSIYVLNFMFRFYVSNPMFSFYVSNPMFPSMFP